ncbi:MAG: cytochrome b/b6 domain-containing protein, partial [Humibacter sp.]
MVALRQGLPRRPGGEAWPPAGVRFVGDAAPVAVPETPVVFAEAATAGRMPLDAAFAGARVRQGLPRVAGGDPWPPVTAVVALP